MKGAKRAKSARWVAKNKAPESDLSRFFAVHSLNHLRPVFDLNGITLPMLTEGDTEDLKELCFELGISARDRLQLRHALRHVLDANEARRRERRRNRKDARIPVAVSKSDRERMKAIESMTTSYRNKIDTIRQRMTEKEVRHKAVLSSLDEEMAEMKLALRRLEKKLREDLLRQKEMDDSKLSECLDAWDAFESEGIEKSRRIVESCLECDELSWKQRSRELKGALRLLREKEEQDGIKSLIEAGLSVSTSEMEICGLGGVSSFLVGLEESDDVCVRFKSKQIASDANTEPGDGGAEEEKMKATTNQDGEDSEHQAVPVEQDEKPRFSKRRQVSLDQIPRRAFVTALTKSCNVPGALSLAHSLRLVGTRALVVCLVTEEVMANKRATQALKAIFHKVVLCNHIGAKNPRPDNPFIDSTLAKWNCLDLPWLTQLPIEKVIFLAVGAIVLQNIDDLFDLDAPAGTFCCPENPVKEAHREISTQIYYPSNLTHGDCVSNRRVSQALHGHGFVPPASSLVLSTMSHEDFETNVLTHLKSKKHRAAWDCTSRFDAKYIASCFIHGCAGSSFWTHIDEVYDFIPWHFDRLRDRDGQYKRPRVLKFYGNKPWDKLAPVWDDFRVWWSVVTNLLFHSENLYGGEKIDLFKSQFDLSLVKKMERREVPCFWCSLLFGEDDKRAKHAFFHSWLGKVVCPQNCEQ